MKFELLHHQDGIKKVIPMDHIIPKTTRLLMSRSAEACQDMMNLRQESIFIAVSIFDYLPQDPFEIRKANKFSESV